MAGGVFGCGNKREVTVEEIVGNWAHAEDSIHLLLGGIPYYTKHKKRGQKVNYDYVLISMQPHLKTLGEVKKEAEEKLASFSKPIFLGYSSGELKSGANKVVSYVASLSTACTATSLAAGLNVFGIFSDHALHVATAATAGGVWVSKNIEIYLTKQANAQKQQEDALQRGVINNFKFIEDVSGFLLMIREMKAPSPTNLERQSTRADFSQPSHVMDMERRFHLASASYEPDSDDVRSAPATSRRIMREEDMERELADAIRRAFPNIVEKTSQKIATSDLRRVMLLGDSMIEFPDVHDLRPPDHDEKTHAATPANSPVPTPLLVLGTPQSLPPISPTRSDSEVSV